jgi:hypothetical protein
MLKEQRNIGRRTKFGSNDKKIYYSNKKDGKGTSDEDTDENHFPHLLISYIYNHYLHQRSRIHT